MSKIPTPEALVEILFQVSLLQEEREEIVDNLPYLSENKIIQLYDRLADLKKIEEEIVRNADRIDLKYRLQLEQAIANAKTCHS